MGLRAADRGPLSLAAHSSPALRLIRGTDELNRRWQSRRWATLFNPFGTPCKRSGPLYSSVSGQGGPCCCPTRSPMSSRESAATRDSQFSRTGLSWRRGCQADSFPYCLAKQAILPMQPTQKRPALQQRGIPTSNHEVIERTIRNTGECSMDPPVSSPNDCAVSRTVQAESV